MSRGNITAIVVIVLLIGAFVFISRSFNDDSDYMKWQFDYRYDGEKKAYDRDFCIDYFKKDAGTSNFNKLEERLSRTEDLSDSSLYLFYNQRFDIDALETQALYDFVAAGNDALIIAHEFNFEFFNSIRGIQVIRDEFHIVKNNYDSASTLLDTINIRGKLRTPVSVITYSSNPFQTSFVVDTVNIDHDDYASATAYDWSDEEVYDEDEYSYEEEDYTYEEEDYAYEEEDIVYDEDEVASVEIDTDDEASDPEKLNTTHINLLKKEAPDAIIEQMGTSNTAGTNLLKIKYGEGHFYLHSQPVLFTNVQFDKPEVYDYVQLIFNEIEYKEIYWDELAFQFLNTKNDGYGLSDKSYFEYIFKNRALKTAFYFFLIGLGIFLIVGIKRKYNNIEIVDPVTNSSIDFSKTIARLYWLNPNHRKMADQKMKMFLFEVRNRYGLSTHVLDEDFKVRFKAKSGVQEKVINRLFDAYNLARKSPRIHHDVLVQISNAIVSIRKDWK
ncbi:MAG: hypothetical protein ACI9JN_001883 [Bacteroidia bacterium]|jgi:hypothetical protein